MNPTPLPETPPSLMKPAPSIKINLDKPRTLILDFNALETIEELTGKRIMGGEFRAMSASDVRAFFYACLIHEDPELTLEQVGRFLLPGHYAESIDIIVRLILADTNPKVLAPFVRTDQVIIDAALDLAGVGPKDILFDLGCGDGSILVSAGKRGAKVVGVEMDPERALISRAALLGAGLEGEVLEQLIQDTSVQSASVIFVYLLTTANTKIRPILMRDLKTGTRIVSHDFPFQGWTPERVIEVEDGERAHQIYLYIHGQQTGVSIN